MPKVRWWENRPGARGSELDPHFLCPFAHLCSLPRPSFLLQHPRECLTGPAWFQLQRVIMLRDEQNQENEEFSDTQTQTLFVG